MRVLIVQDNPSLPEQFRPLLENQVDEMRKMLETEGFDVDVALSAQAAFSQLDRSKRDIMVVDAAVPGLSGFELCGKLKQAASDVPVVLVVDPTDPRHILRALDGATDMLIAKPFGREDLASRVRQALQSAQGGVERTPAHDRTNGRVFDLLCAAFGDLVRTHHALNERTSELANARQAAQSFAHELERRVRERTRELMERQDLQHQALKMEVLGEVTGGIAHDFNNILTVVVGNLDTVSAEAKGNPRVKRLTGMALDAAMRGAELTRQLLAFSRKQPLAPRLSDVNDVVASMAQMLNRILGDKVDVDIDAAEDLWPVIVDPAQFQAAISNLSKNAREAMPDGGKLRFQTRNVVLDAKYAAANLGVAPGDYCLLSVSDTGTGMSPNILARVFEPLFTTKPGPQTAGLGLSTVFGFVKQSGGHVKIESQEGRGTTVRIYLPRASAEQGAARKTPEFAPHPPSGNETILVVEDDAQVRRTVVQQLRALGYSVIETDRAGPALAALDRHADIDLLFTDMILPGGIGGRELAREARIVKPDLPVLFTSGYLRGLRADHRLDPEDVFIGKPYRLRDLAQKVREALGQQQQETVARG